MPVADQMIAKGAEILATWQTQAGVQDRVRQMFLDLVAMKPSGLAAVPWIGTSYQDFAQVIDQQKQELRPFVTVYAAATGLMGPWVTVLGLWCRAPIPQNDQQQLNADVKALLESLFRGYATLVATT